MSVEPDRESLLPAPTGQNPLGSRLWIQVDPTDDEADDQAFKDHLELVNIGKRLKELQRENMELTDRQVIVFCSMFLIKLNQGIFARKKGVEEAL